MDKNLIKDNMVRCFLAITLDDEIRQNLMQAGDELSEVVGGKRVSQDNLHITLKFFGEVAQPKVKDLVESLRTYSFSDFRIQHRGLGVFPNSFTPRVLWAGVGEGEMDVVRLNKRLGEHLSATGFKKDVRFHPHTTLFRMRRQPDQGVLDEVLDKYDGISFGAQDVAGFSLMASTLTAAGPVYEELERFK